MTTIQRIVFIGFRATGKSNIAKRVAERLGWQLYSIDALLEEHFGEPISSFVAREGWQAFRRAEAEQVRQLSALSSCIIDCGGGIVEQDDIVKCIIHNAFVVHVTADIETIIARLERKGNRPLLSANNIHDDVRENFARRKPLYERYAHCVIDTSARTKEQAVEELLVLLSAL